MRWDIKKYAVSLSALLFPELCAICNRISPLQASQFCLSCQFDMPISNSFFESENEVLEHFWGRIPIEFGAAYYHFYKGGKVQELIHQIKYGGRKDLCVTLGKKIAEQMLKTHHFDGIDLIIPVPLHQSRQKKRGYNQSELISKGISARIGVACDFTSLQRTRSTKSQTNKNRLERILNLSSAFCVSDSEQIAGKHILLVDDVITTGSTLELCASMLLEHSANKVSVVCLAIAR